MVQKCYKHKSAHHKSSLKCGIELETRFPEKLEKFGNILSIAKLYTWVNNYEKVVNAKIQPVSLQVLRSLLFRPSIPPAANEFHAQKKSLNFTKRLDFRLLSLHITNNKSIWRKTYSAEWTPPYKWNYVEIENSTKREYLSTQIHQI